MDILKRLATELNIGAKQVENAVALLDEGNTVPFIARYRKEVTGGLTDETLRLLEEKLTYYRNLEDKRADILRLMEELGVLTDELKEKVLAAKTVTELDDLYRPYRPKKRTRATIAKEKGLEPLAQFILAGEGNPLEEAQKYVDPEKGVETVEDALAGAKDIIAEVVSDDAEVRKAIRRIFFQSGVLITKKKETEAKGKKGKSAAKSEEFSDIENTRVKEKAGKGKFDASTFAMYFEFSEGVSHVQPHRVLAINRGEKEGHLVVKIELPGDEPIQVITRMYIKIPFSPECAALVREAAEDGYKRLIFPSVEREVRTELTEKAEVQALVVFRDNLKRLLLQPPVAGKRILGFDPGYRTGCKLACVDETGKLLDTAVIYPTPPRNDRERSAEVVTRLIKKHRLNAISIGNGTASREAEEFIAELLETAAKNNVEELKGVAYTIVSEAGASVYSASPLALKEFPQLDVAERSAISIARRIQDPLAELVKIDPKSIGVGQYQHDVNQKNLGETLERVVEDTVNHVGVDINTASPSLLGYVAGINKTVATNIVAYREEKGRFNGRKQLLKVPKLGPKLFTQCAGFLRIPDAENYFDRSAVHPESYEAAKKFMELYRISPEELGRPESIPAVDVKLAAEKLGVGEPTLQDIVDEFRKPGRDPREDLPQPVFKKGIAHLEDLYEGMLLDGVIRNVVDFGAFVDIGVHQDGLVHISELADKFVKHPLDLVKVGDVVKVKILSVDLERKRISLSMKQAQ